VIARDREQNLTAETRRNLESYLGPSFAVKVPLIQDDSLKRGEFCAAQLLWPRMNAKDANQKSQRVAADLRRRAQMRQSNWQ
jgi:hypothetical protein